jgi:hypothetical protein
VPVLGADRKKLGAVADEIEKEVGDWKFDE